MQSWTVLAMDDSAEILNLLRCQLQSQALVLVASSGEVGLATAVEARPDLVFLDHALSGMQGLEVCRVLKQDPRTAHIPVVFLTTRGEERHLQEFQRAGAARVINKPFTRQEVLTACRDLALRHGAGGCA